MLCQTQFEISAVQSLSGKTLFIGVATEQYSV